MRRTGPLRVHVLVLVDCTPFVPVGVVELLRKSADLAARQPGPFRPLDIKLISAAASSVVRTAGGLTLTCDATLRTAGRADLVVVPAVDPELDRHLADNRAVVPWLKRAYGRGAEVASACTGAFLLAEAGLLDDRAATTHWAFQELLSARYPRIRLKPQAIVVDQGRVVTAGGATSFISLALFLVERLLGPQIAHAASRMFLIDPNKAPQGAYAMFSAQKSHGDDAILSVQEWIEANPARQLNIEGLAKRAAMSRRTFVRRFRSATGNSAREYVQRVRVEAAKRMLERDRVAIGEVARRVGYEDPVGFRKIFIRSTGVTPGDYRARYGARSEPAWVTPARRGVGRRAKIAS